MKFFSGRLYKEAFRQTRAIGSICVVISGLISAFYPFIYYIQERKDSDTYVTLVDMDKLVSGLSFISIVVPLLLIIKLFSFMFKRSSSDFYHALPYTRQCLYITHFAAALTWCLITLVVCMIMPSIFYGINTHRSFKPEFLLNNFVVGLVIMLFVMGALLIAVSVTGRSILAIELAAFIVFLPRVLILIALTTVDDITMMIDINQIPFLSVKYSLPLILTIGSAFDYSGYLNAFTFLPGIVCSLVFAIIYLVAGCFLFCRRHSETAENAVPGRRLQIVLRVVYSILFFFLAVSSILIEGFSDSAIIFLVIGLLVYFGYELITTKKFKTLIKAIPGLAFVAILSVAFAVIIKISGNNVLNNVPSAEDIQSIEIISSNGYYYWGEAMDYNELLKSSIVFENKEINSIVAKSYSDMADMVKNEGFNPYSNDYVENEFKINLKNGGSKVRVLYLKDEDNARLQTVMLEQPEYYKASYAIPDEASITEFSTKEYNVNLWKQFVAEYNKLTEQEKNYILGYEENDYLYEEGKMVFLQVDGYYGSTRFQKGYYVYKDMMPKTVEMYNEYIYKEQYGRLMDIMETVNNQDISTGAFNLFTYGVISLDDTYIENFDLYVYIEDGAITGAEFNANIINNDDSGTKTDESEIATDGDATEEEDKYYYSGNEKNIYVYDLSVEEAEKFIDLYFGMMEYEHETDLDKPSCYFNMNYWDDAGFDYEYKYVDMQLNINEEGARELLSYIEQFN
ncbi:MAG: hypothetical protein ACI39R_06480 [Lachnospiraceae bacterium]